jgi:hypothetical protein
LKEVAKTWVAREGMIDKNGGFLVGSIVAETLLYKNRWLFDMLIMILLILNFICKFSFQGKLDLICL